MIALLFLVLAQSPSNADLSAVEARCSKNSNDCQALWDAQKRAAADWQQMRAGQAAELQARQARADADSAAEDASEAQTEEATRAACGKDYQRVRVGMPWARVQRCAGPFTLAGETAGFQVWGAPGGTVRVSGGRVIWWKGR